MLLFLVSCDDRPPPPPGYAFYHWQTRFDSTYADVLSQYGAERLYLKAFDVSWANERPEPTALLELDSAPTVAAVPVVFITNEVFERLPSGDLAKLADDVAGLLAKVFTLPFDEVQIDCDWTAGTRQTYFEFLRLLKQKFPEQHLSCTVRLHQYRDRAAQGIPPVDRGVLMAYNTGDLDRWEAENTIVDTVVINSYVDGQPPYPLPLDLAVAVYDWAAVYRRDALAYLINEPDLNELSDTARFTALTPRRFRVDSSTYLDGLYLYSGDLIRLEVADPAGASQLVESLWPRVAGEASERVIIYRIGSRQFDDR